MIENKLVRLQAMLSNHARRIRKFHHKSCDVCFDLSYDGSNDEWTFLYSPYLGNRITFVSEGLNLDKLLDEVEGCLRTELKEIQKELDCWSRNPKEHGTVVWNDFVSEKNKRGLKELAEQARAVRVKAEQQLLIQTLIERDASLEESDLFD